MSVGSGAQALQCFYYTVFIVNQCQSIHCQPCSAQKTQTNSRPQKEKKRKQEEAAMHTAQDRQKIITGTALFALPAPATWPCQCSGLRSGCRRQCNSGGQEYCGSTHTPSICVLAQAAGLRRNNLVQRFGCHGACSRCNQSWD